MPTHTPTHTHTLKTMGEKPSNQNKSFGRRVRETKESVISLQNNSCCCSAGPSLGLERTAWEYIRLGIERARTRLSSRFLKRRRSSGLKSPVPAVPSPVLLFPPQTKCSHFENQTKHLHEERRWHAGTAGRYNIIH